MSRSGSQGTAHDEFAPAPVRRRLPVGAELVAPGRTHFRVWAADATVVELVLNGRAPAALQREDNGYWSIQASAVAGDRYQYRIGHSDLLYPDPASRFQPDGPHGASLIVDPTTFEWTDGNWRGPSLEGQVLYELHVGTFTREGTFRAAARELRELCELGVTGIELMPLAEFDGRFGWGYDGVDLFAPYHGYGMPDELRQFVDDAHRTGIAVILDVVYNHFGPSGNYLRAFSRAYFTDAYDNEWGDAINFDGSGSAPVREFFVSNAQYWIEEFHLDGLRLDATQQIFDKSARHILTEIGEAMRGGARHRRVFAVAESEPQNSDLVRPADQGGMGLDGLWNDDFHHSAMVALTGRREAYYSDTTGAPQEFIAAAKYGYLFQGQHYSWQRNPRGLPALDLEPWRFVVFLQNHDQVANSARGLRMHWLGSPSRVRALTALLLLMPGTPMLFQGQEFAASAPFLYFADHDPELATAVRNGRAEFLSQFPSARGFQAQAAFDPPAERQTFERCALDFSERKTHASVYALHRDLLRLRRETPAFRSQRRGLVDGTVISGDAFALRYILGDIQDRLLIVNLGHDTWRPSIADPLIAPPRRCDWEVEWSSEDPQYGGLGTPNLWPEDQWWIPADSALVLRPLAERRRPPGTRRRTA
jgi:maltooligosyltrehalose trehalohydrolase